MLKTDMKRVVIFSLILAALVNIVVHAQDIAYISASQLILRDNAADSSHETAVVKNGERVQILKRERRFALVQTAVGAKGWMEQRYLVDPQVSDGFQKLAQEEKRTAVAATGTVRSDTKLHLRPDRKAGHLYQLDQGAKVAILKHITAELSSPREDWCLIRGPEGQVGWALARMIDLKPQVQVPEASPRK